MTDNRSKMSTSNNLVTQLHSFSLKEQAVAPFHFESTARSHGWVALQPFEWHPTPAALSRVHRLTGGKLVRLWMQEDGNRVDNAVEIKVEAADPLTSGEKTEIRQVVRRMLRLDEDLTEFYRLHAQMGNEWNLRLPWGSGRLLRCPTLFEDIIYTLCTTNIAWSGTKRMVEQLVSKLGDSVPGNDEWRAFPTAETLAVAGPEFLRQETGLGYRSGYVWELSQAVTNGSLNLSDFEDPEHPTESLHQALLQIKGVGNYAAATILMLLGRYEHLAIDSEMRAFVSKKYSNGQPVSEAQIRTIYAPWGRWQYLAYWFDAPE